MTDPHHADHPDLVVDPVDDPVRADPRGVPLAGYSRVNVVLADAETGVPEHAPYDRIIVTAGAWDIPPVWVKQLADGGRIVAPLRMRGLTRSLALERDGNRLVSRSAMICGFVKMQGAGAYQERLLLLGGTEIRLRFDDGGPDDPHLLDGVLGTERAEVWPGVTIGRAESFDTLQFWLATTLPGFCLLAVDAERDCGLVAAGNRWFNLAAVDGASFAYLTTCPAGPEGRVRCARLRTRCSSGGRSDGRAGARVGPGSARRPRPELRRLADGHT